MGFATKKVQAELIDQNGTSYGVKHIGNKPRVSATPYTYDIVEGNVTDHESFRALGYNSNIGTTLEDITETGINVPLPATALAMEVISGDAADDSVILSSGTATGGSTTTLVDTGANFVGDGVAAGDFVTNDNSSKVVHGLVLTVDDANTITLENPLPGSNLFENGDSYRIVDADSAGDTGVKVVEVHGLDASYDEISEFVMLNGTTQVATTNNFIRINNIHGMFVGTNMVAEGNIDVRQVATPANIMSRVGAGGNMNLQCHYTVPNGKTMFITDWSASASGTKPVRMILRATCDFSYRHYMRGVFHFQDIVVLEGNTVNSCFPLPLKCPAKTDVKVSGNALSVTGEGSASFGFWLE